jgi:mycothiol synthase
MSFQPTFPPGLRLQGAAPSDIPIITALLRISETFDAGEPSVTAEDVESEWMHSGFDPAVDALLAFEDGHAIAYAEVPGWRAEATVRPDARGRGIGTAILAWIEKRAVERAVDGSETRVGQTVIDINTGAISLFVRRGYTPRHTSWVLRLPDGITVDHPPLPGGITIRPFDPDREEWEVYRVIEDAFNEWPTRVPTSFEDWRSAVTRRADFDPALLLVAATDSDVVGVAFGIPYPDEGWVQQLAVRRESRGQGLAKALLRASFDEFHRRGSPNVGLSTDSRTGALDLYLDVGMVVRSSYTHYSKLLAPARSIPGEA